MRSSPTPSPPGVHGLRAPRRRPPMLATTSTRWPSRGHGRLVRVRVHGPPCASASCRACRGGMRAISSVGGFSRSVPGAVEDHRRAVGDVQRPRVDAGHRGDVERAREDRDVEAAPPAWCRSPAPSSRSSVAVSDGVRSSAIRIESVRERSVRSRRDAGEQLAARAGRRRAGRWRAPRAARCFSAASRSACAGRRCCQAKAALLPLAIALRRRCPAARGRRSSSWCAAKIAALSGRPGACSRSWSASSWTWPGRWRRRARGARWCRSPASSSTSISSRRTWSTRADGEPGRGCDAEQQVRGLRGAAARAAGAHRRDGGRGGRGAGASGDAFLAEPGRELRRTGPRRPRAASGPVGDAPGPCPRRHLQAHDGDHALGVRLVVAPLERIRALELLRELGQHGRRPRVQARRVRDDDRVGGHGASGRHRDAVDRAVPLAAAERDLRDVVDPRGHQARARRERREQVRVGDHDLGEQALRPGRHLVQVEADQLVPGPDPVADLDLRR